jgi:hypothetical protein
LDPQFSFEWLSEAIQGTGGALTLVKSSAELIDSVSRFSVPEN